mmetsp:Transcript_25666/g.53525  ORF Transcript_25666/g.53525 Transcript_25666/m.53525 type:complete len:80 (+) Transcript_25666:659-898(+)
MVVWRQDEARRIRWHRIASHRSDEMGSVGVWFCSFVERRAPVEQRQKLGGGCRAMRCDAMRYDAMRYRAQHNERLCRAI